MKITRFFPWIGENIMIIVPIGLGAIFVSMMFFILITTNPNRTSLPIGTEVIVKGTDIHGTVLRWNHENVTLGFVDKTGLQTEMTYNYNLLKKQ